MSRRLIENDGAPFGSNETQTSLIETGFDLNWQPDRIGQKKISKDPPGLHPALKQIPNAVRRIDLRSR